MASPNEESLHHAMPENITALFSAAMETAKASIPKGRFRGGPHAVTRRLLRDLRGELKNVRESLENNKDDYPCLMVPLDSDIHELLAVFRGPTDTPYEGGLFYLRISVPLSYPYEPPHVRFLTKIYHPNVHENGEVCASGLSHDWNPAWSLDKMVLFIASLLATPDLDDPKTSAISKEEFLNDTIRFRDTARHWTELYAAHRDLRQLFSFWSRL